MLEKCIPMSWWPMSRGMRSMMQGGWQGYR
jgi:hypothetical protein